MRSRDLSQALVSMGTVALLLLGGCHRQAPAPQGAAAAGVKPGQVLPAGMKAENRACHLITRDDAEEVLGGPVQTPITSLSADIGMVSSRCGYITAGGHPVKVLTLLASQWQKASEAKISYERAHALAQQISGQAPEAIDGLGERAYWVGGTLNRLNVLSGDTWLVVTDTFGPGVNQEAPARAAAAIALRRQAAH